MKKITEKTKVTVTLKQLRKLVKESRMWRGTIKLKNIQWASDDPKLPKEAEIYVEYPLLDDWEDAELEEWEAIEDAMREKYGTEPSDADIDERDDGVDWDDWDALEDDEEQTDECEITEDDKNGPDLTIMSDDELKRIVREWWNNKASPDDRRCSIYYTQHDIDDYSWVWFVENFLKLPGFNSNDYDAEQSDFCAHVCCDILGKLTERFFTKNL